MLMLVSFFAVAIVATVAVLIVVGARAAATRAGLPASSVAKKTALVVGGWLAVTAGLAASGVLADFEARPPRMMILLASSFVVFTLATRAPIVRQLLEAAPRHWIVALQSMRVPIELGLFALFSLGRLPAQMTFEGRNFDVLAGLTAPFVAFGVARGILGRRALIVWNVGSLALLLVIMGIAVTSLPGPLHLDWPGPIPTIVASWPFVWLPSFLVPVALFGHILSLRQAAAPRLVLAGRSRSLRHSS